MADSKLWAQAIISEVSESMDFLLEEKGKHGRSGSKPAQVMSTWKELLSYRDYTQQKQNFVSLTFEGMHKSAYE